MMQIYHLCDDFITSEWS